MKFMDSSGALKLRYVPLVLGWVGCVVAVYASAVSIGPAIGMIFIGFILIGLMVACANLSDRVGELEKQLAERGLVVIKKLDDITAQQGFPKEPYT